MAEGNDRELAAVAERFWRTTRSLRYIFFADPEGVIYLGIPISGTSNSSELLLSRRLELPAELKRRPQNPWCASTSPPMVRSPMCSSRW